jgi:hypothetical protein
MTPEPPCRGLTAPAELSADRGVAVDQGMRPPSSDENLLPVLVQAGSRAPYSTRAGYLARRADGYLIRPVKEIPVTATTPGHQFLPAGLPRLAVGSWRVDPARSYTSFAARAVGRPVLGRVPLTGRVLITEPIEDSTARLAARTSAISTGSPLLDRLLAVHLRRRSRRPGHRPGRRGLLRGHPGPDADLRVLDSRVLDNGGHGPGRFVRQRLRLLRRPGALVRWLRSSGRCQRPGPRTRRGLGQADMTRRSKKVARVAAAGAALAVVVVGGGLASGNILVTAVAVPGGVLAVAALVVAGAAAPAAAARRARTARRVDAAAGTPAAAPACHRFLAGRTGRMAGPALAPAPPGPARSRSFAEPCGSPATHARRAGCSRTGAAARAARLTR